MPRLAPSDPEQQMGMAKALTPQRRGGTPELIPHSARIGLPVSCPVGLPAIRKGLACRNGALDTQMAFAPTVPTHRRRQLSIRG
jgi:hypothetical protein